MSKCNGDGSCLRQTEYLNEYIRDEECIYKCEPEKCSNFILCNEIEPRCYLQLNTKYNLCRNCHMLFGTWGDQKGKGKLNFIDNIECVICYETKINVSQPNCEHSICIDCFKRCYYGEDNPKFPYEELENEYYDNPNDPKWNNYEKIKEWLEADKLFEEKFEKNNEKNLKSCPLCRK